MSTENTSHKSIAHANQINTPSTQVEMDQAIDLLLTHKDTWAKMNIPERIALLDQIKQDMLRVEERWISSG